MTDDLVIHLTSGSEQSFFCTGCGVTFEPKYTAHRCPHPENAHADIVVLPRKRGKHETRQP